MFDIRAERSAFARAREWRAAQIDRVVGIRASIAALEAHEARVLAALLLDAEGEAGEGSVDGGDPPMRCVGTS